MRLDKIGKAYMAMKRPKKYPTLETVFGSHSRESLTEDTQRIDQYADTDHYADYKKEDSIHEKHKLTGASDDVSNSFVSYTKDSYHINKTLHKHYGGEELNQHDTKQIPHIKNISGHLDKHLATEHFHVFTGVKHSPFKNIANVNGNHMVHLPSFTSTTTNVKKAVSFSMEDHETKHDPNVHSGDIDKSARHVLKIHVHPGVSIASVRHLSTNSHEEEMLMNRGYNLNIDPKPTKIEGSKFNVYVWNAYPVSRRGKPQS
jgi:hypothetical protein